MDFKSQKFKVLDKADKPNSKWLSLINENDVMQFVLYSPGKGGSGTTYHLYVNDELVIHKKTSNIYEKQENAFGSNVIDYIMENVTVEDLGY